jgi:hypothetical protein
LRSLSRRSVLAVAGGTIVTLLPGPLAAASVKSRSAELKRSRFLRLVGFHCALEAGGLRSTARLESVDDLRSGTAGDDLAFSLLFRPLTGPEPVAGIRIVRAPGLEPVELFLVPVDRGPALRLQAVVNRRVPR